MQGLSGLDRSSAKEEYLQHSIKLKRTDKSSYQRRRCRKVGITMVAEITKNSLRSRQLSSPLLMPPTMILYSSCWRCTCIEVGCSSGHRKCKSWQCLIQKRQMNESKLVVQVLDCWYGPNCRVSSYIRKWRECWNNPYEGLACSRFWRVQIWHTLFMLHSSSMWTGI